MIIFNSSKTMNSCTNKSKVKLSVKSSEILKYLEVMSQDEVSNFFKIKNKTLLKTYDYYKTFNQNSNYAIELYDGISFKQITSRSNLKNLFIISAFYGLINSKEQICNYRLDFTKKVVDINLYNHWQDYNTNLINQSNFEQVLNACSKEYENAIDINKINKKVFNLVFDNDNFNSVDLKKCRGQIVNFCLENNIIDYNDLINFKSDFYKVKYIEKTNVFLEKRINNG